MITPPRLARAAQILALLITLSALAAFAVPGASAHEGISSASTNAAVATSSASTTNVIAVNLTTGRKIQLTATEVDTVTSSVGALTARDASPVTVIQKRVTAAFPRTLLGLSAVPNSRSVTPLDWDQKNLCDRADAWCVTITMNFYYLTYDGQTCTTLTNSPSAPAFLVQWTRLDPQVTATAVVNVGAQGGPGFCTAYRDSLSYPVGGVYNGESRTYAPPWVGVRVQTSYSGGEVYYNCGDVVSTLSRRGSDSWQVEVETGEGDCNGAGFFNRN